MRRLRILLLVLAIVLLSNIAFITMKLIFDAGGRTIRAPNFTDCSFDVTSTPVVTNIPESILIADNKDANYTTHTDAATRTEAQLSISNFIPVGGSSAVRYTSLDPTIATVNATTGAVTRVGNGTARIVARANGVAKRIDVPVSYTGDTVTTTFNYFLPGTLGKHVCDTVDNRISRITADNRGKYAPQYTILNNGDASPIGAHCQYRRNPNCWLKGIDLTCISVWNSRGDPNTVAGGIHKGGVMISPRHIAFAYHYPLQINPNAVVRFVTNTLDRKGNNIIVERHIVASIGQGYAPQIVMGEDIGLGILDKDVPPSIGIAKVLPKDWWTKYMFNNYGNAPVLYTLPERYAYIGRGPGAGSGHIIQQFPKGRFPHREILWENIGRGDSGSPWFLIINNQLVFGTNFYGPNSGPSWAYYQDNINAAMTALSQANPYPGGGTDSYQLTVVDLSGFNSY